MLTESELQSLYHVGSNPTEGWIKMKEKNFNYNLTIVGSIFKNEFSIDIQTTLKYSISFSTNSPCFLSK